MEFRLLGPLEVRDGDRALPLGGAKQRALLAVLLLHANEVVSRDRLIDELWGEHPPETAVTSVQVYVSRLRKVLPPEVLVTQPPGYVLRVDPEQVDVRRAERALDHARAALENGEPEHASRLLVDALGLWQGEPLADLAHEAFAQPEIARLQELRLVLTEERIEANLALGRHAKLAAELESLVRRFPLRERLREHLMLALYRAGRQAEALEAYHDARRTLVDELGIDPGTALQQLEKAILNHDPKLDLPELEPRAASPKPAEPAPEPLPERKVVTILFADLVGSTERGVSDDPERMHATLERFYDAMAEEIEHRGGTVEKFVGDAVMAVFGAPSAQEDHAERALHAALGMQRRIVELFSGALALRIGVNTGEIVLGEARQGGSFVTGDAVNVAARLQKAAPPGGILAGERTGSLARGAFAFAEPQRVAANGKEAPLAALRVTGSLALTRPRGIRGLSGGIVGRERELDELRTTYDRVAAEREPHVVTVMADAGIGKTTLVREFGARLSRAAPDPLGLRTGRCLPYGRAVTYRPLAEIIRQQLGINEGDPPEVVLERLGSRAILGLALGLDTAGDLHPSTARDHLHQAAVELLEEATSRAPAVVVVEDLHWAEDPLLDLMERVAREVRGPLLLIGTARLELLDRRPSWGGGRRNTSLLWLEPLSPAESEEMLAELLARDVPSGLRDLVLARSEGNPFFLEELLAVLIEGGALRLAEEGWSLSEAADLAVPDSIRALVAARIDLLSPPEKTALQAAAVIGRTSWADAIRELVGNGDPDLATLEEHDFVRRLPESTIPGEREYVFKHALTREVAYDSIAKARRATLHAGFGEWLESRGRTRDEDASLLAHHYAEAVRPEHVDLAWPGQEERAEELRRRAVAWLRRAAELAVRRFELDEALALIEQALELAEAPTRVGLLRLAADAHRMRFEMGGFREALERALALDPADAVAAEIYGELADFGSHPYMWRDPPSRPDVESWTRQALELAGAGSGARVRALAARASLSPERGSQDADTAIAIAERIADPYLIGVASLAQSRVAKAARDYQRLGSWLDRIVANSRVLSDPDESTNEWFVVAIDYLKLGRLADAAALVAEHEAAAAVLSAHHRVHAVALRVLQETVLGDWRSTSGRARQAEAAAAANRDTPCQFNWRTLAMCALGAEHRGAPGEAGRLEERARELAATGEQTGHEPAFIRLALRRSRLDEVERLVEAAPPDGSLFDVDTPAARLDALVALGDRDRVEAEAGGWLEVPGYTRPFALRAVGVVRGDRSLVLRAAATFDELDLVWRAQETREIAIAVRRSRAKS